MRFVYSKNVSLIFLLLAFFSFTALSCGSGGDDDDNPTDSLRGDQPVVFIANKDMVMQYELYASFDNGGEIIQLSAPLVLNGNVKSFAISPDGQWVAYKADQQENEKFELYVVPIEGGTPVNVSRRFGTLLEVEDFDWAPNSIWIAFRAFNPNSGPTGGNIELFTNRPDGASSIKVSKAPVQGQDVREFAWAPDSRQIAYTANVIQGQPNKFDLYTTSPTTQDNINVTGFFPNFADAKNIAWAPDSGLIAFLADIGFADVNELFAANPSNPAGIIVPISGTIIAGGKVVSFEWAPDSSRIAFIADRETDDQFMLYSVEPDGTDLQEVSDMGASGDVVDFAWAPDAELLAYIADQDPITGVFELFTARADGSFSSIKVSIAAMVGGVDSLAWSPDADYIAYSADQNGSSRLELYVALPGISNSGVKVSGPMVPALPNGNVWDFAWAPDSGRLAYLADQSTANKVELFSSTPDGATNDVVSGPLVSGGNVAAAGPPYGGLAFIWSPDGDRIAYRADQEINDVFELFTAAPDGSENTKISDDLFIGEAVQTFAWGL